MASKIQNYPSLNENIPDEPLSSLNLLNYDSLAIVLKYATGNGRLQDANTLASARKTCLLWRAIIDQHVIGPRWFKLIETAHNPDLQILIYKVDLSYRLVDQIMSAVAPEDLPFGAPGNNIPGRPYFERFSDLTDQLREMGLPIRKDALVLGFEAHPYRTMQKKLDKTLESAWRRIHGALNFEENPFPMNAHAIRHWLNDVENTEKRALLERLNLMSMNLEIMPPEIGKFTHLSVLDLSGNQLTTLPKAIGELKQLKNLLLANNHLTQLPETCGNFTQLTWLDLSRNQFTHISDPIYRLHNLRTFLLAGNQLVSLPETLCRLSLLTSLQLTSNQLETLPGTIGNLSQLTSLHLSDNKLSTLPETIGNLAHLESIDLSHNKLSDLPKSFNHLSSLKSLELSHNELTTFPEVICSLPKLMRLYLSHNRLIHLPSSFGTPPRLSLLDLSFNQLTALPKTVEHFAQRLSGYMFHVMTLNHNSLIFILDRELQEIDIKTRLQCNEIAARHAACSSYKCHTTLGTLFQAIHCGHDLDVLQGIFKDLPIEMQQRINKKESASSPSSPPQDIFGSRQNFVQAVILAAKEKLQSLSFEKRRQVYRHNWILAGRPGKNPQWGETHASENIVRLVDALELATTASNENFFSNASQS